MGKTLVLAEKPSVGKDIARVMKCSRGGNGYLEGDKYVVTWALGHLVTLADPEQYSQKYKTWEIDDLPIIPEKMKTEVIKKSGKQYATVKSLLSRQDISDIVIATDAGREGELVARLIIEKSGVKKPMKRLWISSVTDKAIKEGFAKLRDSREYDNLYASAEARAEADWIVGINATRALTCKYNAQLSCGRVQTPTVAIIAALEEEIKTFKPVPYYGIEASAAKLRFTWRDSSTSDFRTFDSEKCKLIIKKIHGLNLVVKDVKRTQDKTYAPLLYDLTELQRDGNKLYGFSAKETLSIMQSLYETHKLLTYPRTDSRYLTEDVVDTLKDRVKACSVGPYSRFGARIASQPIKGSKNFVNDAKVSDHHAIIPTEQPVFLQDLTDKERKIYDLVVKRFLAVLSKPFEFEKIVVMGNIGKEVFEAKGKVTKSQGWKEIYSGYEDEEILADFSYDMLKDLKPGISIKVEALKETRGETQPPARFTEASLLSAMENPAKYMKNESKDLIKTIGETGGLGTVATRADIIEKLFNSFLIEKRDKYIYTTSKGRQLLELAPSDLKSPALTAQWEQKLSDISRGKLKKDDFVGEMKRYTKEIVKEISSSNRTYVHDNATKTRCPECGSYMLEVKGKRGVMLVCQNRECSYRKSLSQVTNARCPNCHKKMELRGEGEGRIFVCSCGYREKLSAFNKRKQEETKAISFKEAAKFISKQKQKEDENINTALADALSKLKL